MKKFICFSLLTLMLNVLSYGEYKGKNYIEDCDLNKYSPKTSTLGCNIQLYIQLYGFDKYTDLLKRIKVSTNINEFDDYLEKMICHNITQLHIAFISNDNILYVIDNAPLSEVRVIVGDITNDDGFVWRGVVRQERDVNLYRRDRNGWVVATTEPINTRYKNTDKFDRSKFIHISREIDDTDDVRYENNIFTFKLSELGRVYSNHNTFTTIENVIIYTLTPTTNNMFTIKRNVIR